MLYIFGHRGDVTRYTENTYQSITSVSDYSQEGVVFGVEFDIQCTKEGEIVCYHDEDLCRVHSDSKKVVDLTTEDIVTFSIATLSSVVDHYKTYPNHWLDIEFKNVASWNQSAVDKVVDICRPILSNLIYLIVLILFLIKVYQELLIKS